MYYIWSVCLLLHLQLTWLCDKMQLNHISEFPLAAEAVLTSFYVDDGLTGADSIDEAISLQKQLQTLFTKGGFLLRRWNSNTPSVVEQINPE